jgi:ATP synthase protein I
MGPDRLRRPGTGRTADRDGAALVTGMGPDRDRGSGRGSSGPPPNWALALDLGLRLGISVIVGLGLGLIVDGWLHTMPLFTLVGVVLGVGAAMYTIWDVARQAMRR